MIQTIINLLLGLFGLTRKGAPRPSAEESLGATTAQVQYERAARAELELAAAARARADVDRVRRNPESGEVHTDPAAPVNQLPGLHLRD